MSVHNTVMAPRSWIPVRRLTMTFLRDIRTAPRDRVTVVIIGSSSGVRPTASATENISDWISGRPNATLAASTPTTSTAVARATRKPSCRRSCWNGEISVAALSDSAALPNRVSAPVPMARAVASPVWAIEPLNRPPVASVGAVPVTGPGRFVTPYGSPVRAASLAVKARASSTSASAGMTSPTRTRNTSPGTTVSALTATKAPSRFTSALTATDSRSAWAAFLAPPSCTVSSVTDAPRISRMITALGISPVAADTSAAAIRIRHIGSSSLRPTLTKRPASLVSASALGPYFARRPAASAVVSPSTPTPRAVAAWAGVWVQKGATAMARTPGFVRRNG